MYCEPGRLAYFATLNPCRFRLRKNLQTPVAFMKTFIRLLPLPCVIAACALVFAEDKPAPTKSTEETKKMENAKVMKSDEEWRKKLTPEQYAVTREAGTERAFGPAY